MAKGDGLGWKTAWELKHANAVGPQWENVTLIRILLSLSVVTQRPFIHLLCAKRSVYSDPHPKSWRMVWFLLPRCTDEAVRAQHVERACPWLGPERSTPTEPAALSRLFVWPFFWTLPTSLQNIRKGCIFNSSLGIRIIRLSRKIMIWWLQYMLRCLPCQDKNRVAIAASSSRGLLWAG